MGKQKGVFLQGKAGNILYYSWNGIPCERSIPAAVYQSPVVVAQKNANGLSTTMGASARKLLADIIPYPKSMQMQTAVRLALLKWLKAGPVATQPPAVIPFISGLSFNEASLLSGCLHIPLTVNATLLNEVSILVPSMVPATDFNAPARTDHIQLKLVAACINISTGKAIESDSYNMVIPYNTTPIPAQTIRLSLHSPADSITLVVAALEYYTLGNGEVCLHLNEGFRPAQVIGGMVVMS